MKQFLITITLIFALHLPVYAGQKSVVFKFLNQDKYEVYINLQDDYRNDNSIMGSISRQLLRGYFSVDRIPEQYYNVVKSDNISYFGFNISQYVITPKNKDRFKSILWLDEKEHIVKLEVFDTTDTLMFAFSGFDYEEGAMHGYQYKEHHKRGGHKKGKRGDIDAKYKFWDTPEFYKGFSHFHTTVFNGNAMDLAFQDGVNRFSVFIKPAMSNAAPVSKIVYGNYLFSRVIDDTEYTVYGTVSFGFMEEIVNIIHKNKQNIVDIASQGHILTSEIYSK